MMLMMMMMMILMMMILMMMMMMMMGTWNVWRLNPPEVVLKSNYPIRCSSSLQPPSMEVALDWIGLLSKVTVTGPKCPKQIWSKRSQKHVFFSKVAFFEMFWIVACLVRFFLENPVFFGNNFRVCSDSWFSQDGDSANTEMANVPGNWGSHELGPKTAVPWVLRPKRRWGMLRWAQKTVVNGVMGPL